MKEWNLWTILIKILGIAGLICIVISIVQEGNNLFLNIGLLCACIDLILITVMNRRKRK